VVAEASVVEEASMAVGVVSTGEVSVAVSTAVALVLVAFVVALWLPDTLEAESGAAVVVSALAGCAPQVVLRTLPAQDPGSRHLVIHHPGSPSMMGDLLDP
jgi:hypothetical protein